jgi:hypothetical protein
MEKIVEKEIIKFKIIETLKSHTMWLLLLGTLIAIYSTYNIMKIIVETMTCTEEMNAIIINVHYRNGRSLLPSIVDYAYQVKDHTYLGSQHRISTGEINDIIVIKYNPFNYNSSYIVGTQYFNSANYLLFLVFSVFLLSKSGVFLFLQPKYKKKYSLNEINQINEQKDKLRREQMFNEINNKKI